MAEMNKVWAVQSNMKRKDDGSWVPKFDLDAARQFGAVEFIFGHGQAALMGDAAKDCAVERLREFDPDTDYILPIGDTCLVGIAFKVLTQMYSEPIKTLRWDGALKRYDVVMI